ncbi:MAG: coenzyme-B sulfoethylthiotransferase subunit alpha, partial [Candidatus Syntropharchaeia archaeon]
NTAFQSRAQGQNSPVGVPMGYIFDFVQKESGMPDDPVPVSAEACALDRIFYTQWWYGQYMIGTVGATVGPSVYYSNGIYEDWGYGICDWIRNKYGDFASAPMNWDTIHECTKEATMHCFEDYDRYPILPEHHWGVIKSMFTAVMSASCAAWATGKPLAGALAAHHSMVLMQKELVNRNGWGGIESHHHPAFAIIPSVLLDEGMPLELHGPNVPFRSPFADSEFYSATSVCCAHEVRMDAWGLSPIVKVAFADPDLVFDFRNIRDCIAKGALREFKPAGERDIIISP